LSSGAEYRAGIVVSNADPRRTFLTLVGREQLPSDFAGEIDAFKCEGSSFKVNLALSELPSYRALPGTSAGPQHAGTTHLCPSLEYMERAWDDAKYGSPSRHPMLEITIPTVYDPALAPDGKHLMSIFVQYAPYRLSKGTWQEHKESFVKRVIDVLAEYAPNVPAAIEHVHAFSPLDLEQEYGMTGGNIFHGELSPDQLFSLRPVAGWARYATPIRDLYLCGSGTHPGGGVTGAPGHNAAHEILRRHRRGARGRWQASTKCSPD
jgi:phytoene dehydrogenase-like protein